MSGERILLAEDTPISADAMMLMARQLSVEMDVAENGLDAIAMIEKASAAGRPYTLLMVDMMMPVLDGIETTLRLREMGYTPDALPIIAVTAATDLNEVRAYRASGMQAFLSKPVKLTDFRAALNAWGVRPRRRQTDKAVTIPVETLAALGQQFAERNGRTLSLIEATLAEELFDAVAIEDIRVLLHQIAGTAATFGNAVLGDAARRCEGELVRARQAGADLKPVLRNAARELKRRINL